MNSYTLGIVWSIGSYQEDRFIFRHKDKYFLEQIQKYCDNSTYSQTTGKGKLQYVLKTAAFSPEDFPGWIDRNAEQRNLPALDDYKDFLRAYFELHACLGYCTAYSNYGRKNQHKYYKLRLRIYGNYILIMSINKILLEQCGAKLKSMQYSDNNKTACLSYTSLDEIISITDWLTGQPKHEAYWLNVDKKLKIPTIY